MKHHQIKPAINQKNQNTRYGCQESKDWRRLLTGKKYHHEQKINTCDIGYFKGKSGSTSFIG
jgi:hypothetical protein